MIASPPTTVSLIDRLLTYDGHVVVASRSGSGKTTLELNYITQQSEREPGVEWLIITGKMSAWLGLEDQVASDGQSRVIDIAFNESSSIENALRRLRWAVKIQESREKSRVAKKKAGQEVNPRPIRILIDEWLVVLKAAKDFDKKAYQELINLVELIVYKGREDKVFLTIVAQGHHCGTLHIDGDLRTNLGVVALGGAGNYQTITSAINDSALIEDKLERQTLQQQYSELISEDAQGRIFYTSIGGHCVGRMETLPDLQGQTFFEPDTIAPESFSNDSDSVSTEDRDEDPVQSKSKKHKLKDKSHKRQSVVDGVGNDDESEDFDFAESSDSFSEDRLEIERKRLHLEWLTLRLKATSPNDISEARWNLITLGTGFAVFLLYIVPPFNGAVRGLWQTSVKVKETVEDAGKKVDQGIDTIAPDLKATPKTGETIAGYTVTSPYGPRSSPGGVGSTYHRGVDLGTPTGTAIYAVGQPGQKVKVNCLTPPESRGGGLTAVFESMGWEFYAMHLTNCQPGESIAGQIIARTGGEPNDPNAGASTGPHLHWGQRNTKTKQFVPPYKGYVWAAITGELPKPILNRSDLEKPEDKPKKVEGREPQGEEK